MTAPPTSATPTAADGRGSADGRGPATGVGVLVGGLGRAARTAWAWVLVPLLQRRTWAALLHVGLALATGPVALLVVFPVLLAPLALLLALVDPVVRADTVVGSVLMSAVALWPALALGRVLAVVERRLADRLLGTRVVAPRGRQWRRVVLEEASYRELLWLLLRVAIAALLLGGGIVVVGAFGPLVAPAPGLRQPSAAEVLVAGLVLGLVGLHLARLVAWLQRQALDPLLGDVAAARLAQEQQRARRLQDRARLARDLHDSVGHGVTLMVLQAGAARAMSRTQESVAGQNGTADDRTIEALAAIERSGKAVMADLHRVLGLLDPTDREELPGGAGAAPWTTVDQVLEAVSAAGVDVSRVLRPPLPVVAADVEALVVRCLREALTNAATHAPDTRVVVDLHGLERADGVLVSLQVVNEAPTPGVVAPVLPSHRGSGLAGLATDVAAHGGRLKAGATSDAGFAVRVEVPGRTP